MRELRSTRAITNLISDHTFSELDPAPPGMAATGQAPDEPLFADTRRRHRPAQPLRQRARLRAL